jgi:hypothetical protein
LFSASRRVPTHFRDPRACIGLLGVIPILIGGKKLFELYQQRDRTQETLEHHRCQQKRTSRNSGSLRHPMHRFTWSSSGSPSQVETGRNRLLKTPCIIAGLHLSSFRGRQNCPVARPRRRSRHWCWPVLQSRVARVAVPEPRSQGLGMTKAPSRSWRERKSCPFWFCVNMRPYLSPASVEERPNVPSTTSTKLRSSRRIRRIACAMAKFSRASRSVLRRAR